MSSHEISPIRAVLIGGDSLLIECGESLLRGGHEIAAVAASSRRVADWARGHHLTTIDATQPATHWRDELATIEFDWLLSITYLEILPDSVLDLPRRGAINFHDGPLPGYAGLNTPAWAILNGEAEHGISWHLITSGVDEGDVVVSRRFAVAPGETSLSLNTRNFEAAIDSFDELIDAITRDGLRPVPQDPDADHRVYQRIDRPAAAQVLDWTRPTDEVERLLRALTFGPYPNPLGVAKLWSDRGIVLVTEAGRADGSGEAGEVLEVSDERIVVATVDGAVALTSLATLDGAPIDASAAAARLGLAPGTRLPLLDDARREALHALDRRLARGERHHLAALEGLAAVELPWARTEVPGQDPVVESITVEVPATLRADDGAVVTGLATVLSRLAGREDVQLGLVLTPIDDAAGAAELVAPAVPLVLSLPSDAPLRSVAESIGAELAAAQQRGPFARELVARHPHLVAVPELAAGQLLPISVRTDGPGRPASGVVVELGRTTSGWELAYDVTRLDGGDARLLVAGLEAVLRGLVDHPTTAIAAVDLLGPDLRAQVLDGWNDTTVEVEHTNVHQLVEAQVDRTPDVDAVVFEDASLTFAELDVAANRLAHHLIDLGAGTDHLVGIHVDRSIDLVVAVLAVHKAGAAYVPLDPDYPADRLHHMIADSGLRIVVTTASLAADLPRPDGRELEVVALDTDRARVAARPAERPAVDVSPTDLAYCIYTSGSTGLPKGVLIEHRNVVNFFVGMDDRIPHELPATWLAVTSLSFDISVLELLYTLTRGFTTVVYRDRDREASDAADRTTRPAQPMDFSLFYFSGDAEEGEGSAKYRLLLDGARFADRHGFAAVWTPERHFHAFGGLYPQPAVSGAAVAAITENVGIRAGSVVMPLTDPIRVAEAWSIVDNISDGRVGISFASGWQPNDFVLKPENFANAKQAMFDGIEHTRRLWSGETIEFDGPLGPVPVATLPRPVQPELPTWVTSAGNPETYIQAGRIGANVLTHLLGQSIEQLAPKIEAYRQARAEAGFDPDAGVVSLMLHTFVGPDDDEVRELVREPLKAYLGTSFSLLREYAWSFPAFQRPADSAPDDSLSDDDFRDLSDEDLDAVLEFAFHRYFETSGLFGSPRRCVEMVDRLKEIGVDEVACLIDFGVDTDTVLDSLPLLDEVRQLSNPAPADLDGSGAPDVDLSFAGQVGRHGVTHLQCTPSMARMFTLHDESRAALSTIPNLFIGGEAFPLALARDLRDLSPATRVTNMYGPTETTIWSTTWALEGDLDAIPIGSPIANTRIYILDRHRQPVPPGVPGELWIGGAGVVRGYHDRVELTTERFVPDPFLGGEHRMYLTGDLARWRTTDDGAGLLEFLGRTDHQVKIRGYRIELGEIEAQLGRQPGVRECVAVVREETPGDQQLVGYVSTRDGGSVDANAVKDALRTTLPEVMVPGHIVVLEDLPHTPNGKIDRNALPSVAEVAAQRATGHAPAIAASNDVERTVLEVWEETLGRTGIGVEDNFFDIGGHSLLVVRMHRRLIERLDRQISLTDLYRHPTIRGFATSLDSDATAELIQTSVDRAARRRDSLARRRSRT